MSNIISADPGRYMEGSVYIGGKWYARDAWIESLNPATGEPIGKVPDCTGQDVMMAVEAAREASPAWAAISIRRRIEFLERLSNLLRDEGDTIAELITRENGKPLVESNFVDILGTLDFLSGLIKKGGRLLSESRAGVNNPLLMKKEHYIRRLPLGVVGVISPWNLPLAIPMGQILPALLAGNTVVFKPSEHTPFTGLEIAGLIDRAGFPPGVFNCVTGSGNTGKALSEAQIDALLFTGSVATGRKIRGSIGERRMRVQMELGGKDAFIVLADANLERCLNGAIWTACFGSGQACSSAERFYVHTSIFDAFTAKAVKAAEALKVGDGMLPGVDIGPMISESQLSIVERQVREAVSAGATLLTGGKRINGNGFFYPPTVIAGAPHDSSIMKEETFGPVIPIIPFDDPEEALRMANDTEFGLSASIWTSDTDRGRKLAERLNVGSVWINDSSYSHSQPYLPWGGQKGSGLGRTHWIGALNEMTTPQVVGIDSGRARREPWWFPYDNDGLELARNYRIFCREGVLNKFKAFPGMLRALFKLRTRGQ